MNEKAKVCCVGIIIVLLLLQLFVLIDIKMELHSDCTEEIPDKGGVFHEEKQEKYQKPGKLIPNPRLPQWGL